jgi:hypothetical protein
MGFRENTRMDIRDPLTAADDVEVFEPMGKPTEEASDAAALLGITNLLPTWSTSTLPGAPSLCPLGPPCPPPPPPSPLPLPQTAALCGEQWENTPIFFVERDASQPHGVSRVVKHPDWNRKDEFAATSILFVENSRAQPLIFPPSSASPVPDPGLFPGRFNEPIRMALAVANDVTFRTPLSICCKDCVCPENLPSPALNVMPRVGGGSDFTSRTEECGLRFVSLNPPLAVAAPPAPPAVKERQIVRAGGHCVFNGESNIIGDVVCQTVHIKQGGCIIGDVISHGDDVAAGGGCASDPSNLGSPRCTVADGGCPTNSLPCGCPNGLSPCPLEANVIEDTVTNSDESACVFTSPPPGCEDPGVCVGQVGGAASPVAAAVIGVTFARGDVCTQDPLTTWGQIVSDDDVRLGPSVTVNHDGTTGGGVGALVNSVAWIEAAR